MDPSIALLPRGVPLGLGHECQVHGSALIGDGRVYQSFSGCLNRASQKLGDGTEFHLLVCGLADSTDKDKTALLRFQFFPLNCM